MSTFAAQLGLRPEYSWSRPGRFGRPFYSQLFTIERFFDGQIVWQGTEIAWLGTAGTEDEKFVRDIGMYVRQRLIARQPEALRTAVAVTEPSSAQVLESIRDKSKTHFETALNRAWFTEGAF